MLDLESSSLTFLLENHKCRISNSFPYKHQPSPLPFSYLSRPQYLISFGKKTMEATSPAILTPATQTLLQPTAYQESHHHGIFGAGNATIIILATVLPITALVAAILLVIFLCRRSNCRQNTVEDGGGRSNCKDNITKKHNFIYGGYVNPRNAISSPDVRNCISARNLRFSSQTKKKGSQVFTYKELESATDGFKEENVIGYGGFGKVYRGTLVDGTVAAIKMLNREGRQGEREFRVEVDVLSRLHSSYLVWLLGYCADQQHRLLVFEFMPNGNLQHHLHRVPDDHDHEPLDWGTRLRIALDCARALEFLHEYTAPTVIHRDFKSSNILLDENYRAKVSDFGMAKMGSEKINGQVITTVLGTTGYVAPEYALTGKLTTKSDVYSYGVVLLELLTGRVPVDIKRSPGEQVLVSWALPRLTNRQKVMEMVDPALRGQYSKKELIQVAAIAAVCVQSESDYRPLMTDVVQSLIPLVKSPAATCPPTPSTFQHQRVLPKS